MIEETDLKTSLSTILIGALAIAMIGSCSASDPHTSIQVVVGQDQEPHDNFAAGDPLSGAVVRLLQGDAIILEEPVDKEGTAEIDPEPGPYAVQVFLESEEAGCFWGNTIPEVVLPQAHIEIPAHYICSGE